MTDFTPNPPSAPAGGPPPLTPVVLVWPGKAHGQTWMLLWIAFAYVIGAILPWEGVSQTKVLLDAPVKNAVTKETTQIMTRADWLMTQQSLPSGTATVREVIDDRSIGLGRVMMLIGGLSMLVFGFTSVWTRRLSITPTLMTWFEGLVILYFFSTSGVQLESERLVHYMYSSFAPIGGMFAGALGAVGDLFQQGQISKATQLILEPYGIGFHITVIAQISTLLLIVLSIVLGGKKKGPEAEAKPAAKGGMPKRPMSAPKADDGRSSKP